MNFDYDIPHKVQIWILLFDIVPVLGISSDFERDQHCDSTQLQRIKQLVFPKLRIIWRAPRMAARFGLATL